MTVPQRSRFASLARPLRWALTATTVAASWLAMPAAPALAVGIAPTCVGLTTGAAYSQTFTATSQPNLASTPEDGTNTSLPVGWGFDETGTSANTTYGVDDGTLNSGNSYSYGVTADADRAFGGLQSGSNTPIVGACFTNSTGQTITGLTISYTGEQWRLGTAGRADRLDFQYSTSATSLTDTGYTDVDALDFSTPNTAAPTGTKVGNDAANRTVLPATTIPSLSIPSGGTFYIRWQDFNASGADDGLAIDDFSLAPTIADTAPTVTSTTPTSAATGVAADANVTVTFNEAVTVSPTAFTVSCQSGARTVTVTGGSTTFTLDPTTDFGPNEQCTVTVVANQVTDQDAIDPPDQMAADYVFSFTTTGPGDAAPTVSSTTPASNATNVARTANVTVTFSEAVNVTASSFTATCTSGARTVTVSGGPTTYTLDPATDFASDDVCTVTVVAAQVSDVDADDPPDTLAADVVFSFTVVAGQTIKTIGEVQGQTLDSENGATDRSPFAPANGTGAGTETVTVQGVVYEKTLARTSSGGSIRGFFLQNTLTTRDSDPLTSDGIFVFLGSNTGFGAGSGCVAYTPAVGDEIVLSGRVSEFNSLSQLSSGLCVVEVVRNGVNLETELDTFEANPPSDLADVNRYWERREGMRARVPTGSIVAGPTIVFASTADGEVRVINPTHPVAQRAEPYARRTFRDPHPLDDLNPPLFDNGNPYRILLGSLGVKGSADDNTVTIAPAARTFDSLSASLVGGVYFSFGKYSVQVTLQPALTAGPDPSLNNSPASPNLAQEFTVATFNVENLYDFRDDPFDGCDFTGNGGCTGVNPPFDYVPANDAEYQERLGWLASQVINDLKSPDVLLIQEAEDQDICAVTGTALNCGVTNNADGKPDTLQELALRIAATGGPTYEAAYDRNGADDRGIVSAFLYRTDRVQLPAAQASDPVLGSSPTVQYRGDALGYNTEVSNPKALNADLPSDVDTSTGVDGSNVFTRAPQVGLFRIYRAGVGNGDFVETYLVSNHFSSGPDRRVGQRREQAAYNAAIFNALKAANANVRVAIGGDFNVYPRPDDPFPAAPTDQLGPLYEAGLDSLYDVLLAEVPVAAYSYVFDHQAQVLDQIFVSDPLRADLAQIRVAHVNSDWPRDYAPDGPRGISDHDPSVARFTFPAPPDAVAPTSIAATTPTAPNGQNGWFTSNVTVTLTAMDNQGGSGVKEIVYSATGAQQIAQTVVPGATATFQVTVEGTTTVTYFARGNAGNAEAPKTLQIKLDKSAPTAQNDSYNAPPGGSPLTVPAASGVLANDSETVSTPLTAQIVMQPIKGQVALAPDGGFTYTPQQGQSGPDSFTYRASNAAGLATNATVSISVPIVPSDACTPRPPVRVQATPSGGRLQVVVTTSPRNNQAANPLVRLDFGTMQNARVLANGQTFTSLQTLTVSGAQTSVTFTVERITPGQAATVPLTVVDSCGSWETFVGGGPTAF